MTTRTGTRTRTRTGTGTGTMEAKVAEVAETEYRRMGG